MPKWQLRTTLYRCFIPNLVPKSQLFTAKTHKDALQNKFPWMDIDMAFDVLLTCVITLTLLNYPDFNIDFYYLQQDEQIQDGVEKPLLLIDS